jgi:hypothetical protein
MAERIPKSVAKLVVFRAFLASDGKTPATGKTIAITISKNGGAFGNPNAGATNATEISSGFYKFTLDTTDAGTGGPLAWRGAEGTINDAGDAYEVVNATNAGFSALPDAAAEAAGGLYTRGTGAGQIAQEDNGYISVNLKAILRTVLTETVGGYLAAAFKKLFDVVTPVLTAASVNQTGDSYARIGANGAGLTSLATAAQINSLAVNTRANIHVPVEIETPDAATQVYKIRLHLFDVEGNMEAPDSTPTIALTNAAGTDRSSRLSVASNPSTGVYTWDYTATAGDAEEQLVWVFTVVEGALTRTYPATSYVVEETAYRFSSTDRATLNAAATAAALATLSTKVGTPAGASIAVDIAAVKTDTGTLVTRITNTLFSGITYLSKWLGAIAGKTADAPTLAEIQASPAGQTYDNTTDSLEAKQDSGSPATLSPAECNKVADHVRRRTQANVEASTDGDALSLGSEYGFIQQAQESDTTTHAGKLTVFKTDGTTELGQKDLATDAAADPVTGIS